MKQIIHKAGRWQLGRNLTEFEDWDQGPERWRGYGDVLHTQIPHLSCEAVVWNGN